MKVLVLGAGFGGLELSTRLSEELGDDVDVTLIDKGEGFVFGFSKLDVMFGRRTRGRRACTRTRDIVKPGVRFVQTDIRSIDPTARRVETDAGSFDGDVMVVALGADLDPAATPGLVEAGHEFYTVAGRLRRSRRARRLRRRARRRRRHVDAVQVPAGAERDGVADARLPRPSGACASGRRSPWSCRCRCRSRRRPTRRRRSSRRSPSAASSGTRATSCASSTRPARSPASRTAARCRSTCSSACRRTGCRTVVAESGMCVDGWIPVDPVTLATAGRASTPSATSRASARPKAGVFAEGQAAVVAERDHRRRRAAARAAGLRRAGRLLPRVRRRGCRRRRRHVRRRSGAVRLPRRAVGRARPREKSAFGTTRIERWFGRDW